MKRLHQEIYDFVKGSNDKLGPPSKGKCAKVKYQNQMFILGRKLSGEYRAIKEWYVYEGYDSDDLSCSGFYLPPNPGYDRMSVSFEADSIESLLQKIKDEGSA